MTTTTMMTKTSTSMTTMPPAQPQLPTGRQRLERMSAISVFAVSFLCLGHSWHWGLLAMHSLGVSFGGETNIVYGLWYVRTVKNMSSQALHPQRPTTHNATTSAHHTYSAPPTLLLLILLLHHRLDTYLHINDYDDDPRDRRPRPPPSVFVPPRHRGRGSEVVRVEHREGPTLPRLPIELRRGVLLGG